MLSIVSRGVINILSKTYVEIMLFAEKVFLVINNAYDRHRKDFVLISSLFRNCCTQLVPLNI